MVLFLLKNNKYTVIFFFKVFVSNSGIFLKLIIYLEIKQFSNLET